MCAFKLIAVLTTLLLLSWSRLPRWIILLFERVGVSIPVKCTVDHGVVDHGVDLVVLVDGFDTSDPVFSPMEQLTCSSAVAAIEASFAIERDRVVPEIDFGGKGCFCL